MKKIILIFLLTIFLLGCHDKNGYVTTEDDYICSKNGVEYITNGKGLIISYMPDGKIATCKSNN